MMETPAWRKKHPCDRCSAGYGECVSGLKSNLKCCIGCWHPTRWQPNPYTEEDYEEMKRE
jgi:hypothetical protein